MGEDKVKTFLWIWEEGGWGTLKGKNFKGAIRKELREEGRATIFCKDDYSKENCGKKYTFQEIVEDVYNNLKDNTEGVQIFDITDPDNVVEVFGDGGNYDKKLTGGD